MNCLTKYRIQMNKLVWLRSTLICLFVSFSTLLSAQIPEKPNPARLVNDFANLFTPEQKAELENFLVMVDDSTSNQICVVTVNDLGGMDPNQYATELGQTWGIGNAKFDNGIVLLVKPKTADSRGQVYIAVGYGLEAVIPDYVAGKLRDEVLIPHFKQNDYYGGVALACNNLYLIAKGEIKVPREKKSVNNAKYIFIGLFLLILLIIIFRKNKNENNGNNSVRTSYGSDLPFWILMGSAMGGRSSGGGGGSSGGGFGGFGGGGFGGGGAGGSW